MATANSWNSQDPAEVAKGGTGVATTTAYAVQCGGTTATAAHQPIASVGSATEVLTSNGAGALPTFQAIPAGGGAWTFISSVTASNDATVVFTSGIDSTYDVYMITLTSIIPATDDTIPFIRTSTDGGIGYDDGASEYGWAVTGQDATGALASNSNTATYIQLCGPSPNDKIGNQAGESYNANVYILNPSNSTPYTLIGYHAFYTNNSTLATVAQGCGNRKSAADVDAVEFSMLAGNITSGEFRLYGLSKS